MKKMFSIAAMLLIVLVASAERPDQGTFSVYPRVGGGYAFLSVDGIENGYTYNFGADAQYQLTNKLAVSAGVEYRHIKTKETYSSTKKYYTYTSNGRKQFHTGTKTENYKTFNYLDIPLLAHWGLSNHFGFIFGLQPSIKLSAMTHDSKTYLSSKKEVETENSISEGYNGVYLSVPVGFEITIGKSLVFDFQYNYGFTHVVKEFDGSIAVASATVAYRFDL